MELSLILSWCIFVLILFLFLSKGGNIQLVLDGATLPWFYPPGWVFGLVWSTLFILFLVVLYNAPDTQRIVGIVYYALVLAWTPIFVSTKRFDIGFYYLLFVFCLTVGYAAYSQSWFFVPQIIWVTFATFLSFQLFQLN